MSHNCLNHIPDCRYSESFCHMHTGAVVRRGAEEHKVYAVRPLGCTCSESRTGGASEVSE